MNRLRLVFTAVLISLTSCWAVAQNGEYEVIETEVPSDFQPRVDVDFAFSLTDDLSFAINNELRFRDNCTRIDRNYLQATLGYETCDYFSVTAGYIFQSLLTQGDIEYERQWQYRHRVFMDLKAEYEAGDWKLSLTERPLVNLRPWADGIHDPKDEWLIRSKLKADYDIPKTDLTPYAFFELSNTLNTVDYGGGPFVDRLRFCLGMKWETSDFSSIELYYYFDIRNSRDVSMTHGSDGGLYNVFLNKERQYIHILGLSFNFGWD
ncbi:MAG TPA: DUF2490 domain-containing protein [Candidatus Coprenecus pullistercoris]|nr:DUF2490 domain-containing protein [Candidatus Coprenecus pullistercoris]